MAMVTDGDSDGNDKGDGDSDNVSEKNNGEEDDDGKKDDGGGGGVPARQTLIN